MTGCFPRPVPVETLLAQAVSFACTLPGDHPLVTEVTPSGKEIAARRYISGKMVRSHMASILAKLGRESRLQALIFAIRQGVIDVR